MATNEAVMKATKEDAAIAGANELFGYMQQLKAIRLGMTDFLKKYNDETWSTVWASLATAAQNADGSLGTADGTPNTAHPIDTRVGTQTALNKAVTQTMLVSGVTCLNQLVNFFGNVAVTTGNYSQSVDDLAD